MIENALIIGASISTGLLGIAHLSLWSARADLHRVFSYIIGCGCLLIGVIVTSYLLAERVALIDPRLMVVVMVVHLGSGGALIGGAWLARWLYDQHRARRQRIAELIDEAGEDHAER